MKQASVFIDKEIRRRKFDVLKVGDIHDEHQYDALRGHAEEFASQILPDAFAKSGQHFGYRLPIACDAKIGMTWAATH